MKVLLVCTGDEFKQIKQLEDDPNVPLVIDSSEEFDEGEKVFYDVDLDISPDGFSSFDLVKHLLQIEVKDENKVTSTPSVDIKQADGLVTERDAYRKLLDICLYAFNQIVNTPINDGEGTKTYGIAAEIEATFREFE